MAAVGTSGSVFFVPFLSVCGRSDVMAVPLLLGLCWQCLLTSGWWVCDNTADGALRWLCSRLRLSSFHAVGYRA